MPRLDDLPFPFVGKGEQSTLKILLALNRKKVKDTHVVLIEEPENHVSFSTLNQLIDKVAQKCAGKQVLVTTHSAYILNKLRLNELVLLSPEGGHRITDLARLCCLIPGAPVVVRDVAVMPGEDELWCLCRRPG